MPAPEELAREKIDNLSECGWTLAANKRRALIQIATGLGRVGVSPAFAERTNRKTYTAVNFVYRLIKLAGARRVLFLVDRGNLGDQTLKEFQQFVTPDDGRKFTELYNVQHLQSAQLDRVSRVCISTIQRLYSMLLWALFFLGLTRCRRVMAPEETGSAFCAWNKVRHSVENGASWEAAYIAVGFQFDIPKHNSDTQLGWP